MELEADIKQETFDVSPRLDLTLDPPGPDSSNKDLVNEDPPTKDLHAEDRCGQDASVEGGEEDADLQIVPVLCHATDVILVVSVTGWRCKMCNTEQAFEGRETIADHLLQKHAIKEKENTACNFCNEKFIFHSQRWLHIERVHLGFRVSSKSMENSTAVVGSEVNGDLSQHTADTDENILSTPRTNEVNESPVGVTQAVMNDEGVKFDPEAHRNSDCNRVKARAKEDCKHVEAGAEEDCKKCKHGAEEGNQLQLLCKICKEEFQSLEHLTHHLKNVHKIAKSTVLVQKLEDEQTHPKARKGCKRNPVSCEICSQVFKFHAQRTRHIKKMHKDVPYPVHKNKLVCEICNQVFKFQSQCARHVTEMHKGVPNPVPAKLKAGKKKIACEICNQEFKFHAQRTRHVKKMHKDVPYSIPAATKTCSQKGQLSSLAPDSNSNSRFTESKSGHVVSTGTEQGDSRSDSNLPAKTHLHEAKNDSIKVEPTESADDKPASRPPEENLNSPASSYFHFYRKRNTVRCEICHQEFKYHMQRSRHMERVHSKKPAAKPPTLQTDKGKMLDCRFCVMQFRTRTARYHHMKKEHAGQDGKLWSCDRCGARFHYRNELCTHTRGAKCWGVSLNTFDMESERLEKQNDALGGGSVSETTQEPSTNMEITVASQAGVEEEKQTDVKDCCPCPDCRAVFQRKYQTEVHHWLTHTTDEKHPEGSRIDQELQKKIAALMKVVEQRLETFRPISRMSCHETEPSIDFFCDVCDKTLAQGLHRVIRHVWNHYVRPHRNALFQNVPALRRKEANRMFLCPECGEEIPDTREKVSYHLYTRHGMEDEYVHNLKCSFCGIVFMQKTAALSHEISTHRPDNAVDRDKVTSICDVCGEELRGHLALYNHSQRHKEVTELFTCHLCKRSFRLESTLKKHVALHSQPSVSCSHCGKEFLKERSLQLHIKKTHMREFRYKCSQCSAQFATPMELDHHVAVKHEGRRPLKCTLCPQTFICRPTLKRHMRKMHERQTPFVCEICNEAFHERRYLQRHMVVHGAPEPFKCPLCQKVLTSEDAVRNHITKCHKDLCPFACSDCGQLYQTEEELQKHKRDYCKIYCAHKRNGQQPRPKRHTALKARLDSDYVPSKHSDGDGGDVFTCFPKRRSRGNNSNKLSGQGNSEDTSWETEGVACSMLEVKNASVTFDPKPTVRQPSVLASALANSSPLVQSSSLAKSSALAHSRALAKTSALANSSVSAHSSVSANSSALTHCSVLAHSSVTSHSSVSAHSSVMAQSSALAQPNVVQSSSLAHSRDLANSDALDQSSVLANASAQSSGQIEEDCGDYMYAVFQDPEHDGVQALSATALNDASIVTVFPAGFVTQVNADYNAM